MENSPNKMEDEDTEEEYYNFCSSCNSILQSSLSIGSASFESWNEESTRSKIQESLRDIQNVDERVVTRANATSSIVKHKSIVHPFIPECKNQKVKKIDHSADKETKKVAANCPKIISNQSLNVTLKFHSDKFLIRQSSKKTIQNSEIPSANDNPNLSQNLSWIKTQNTILNRRKRIFKKTKFLLDLCDCMNIMCKAIRQGVRRKNE